MKITKKESLITIQNQLEDIQSEITNSLSLDDSELNNEYDIYNKIGNIINIIDELLQK